MSAAVSKLRTTELTQFQTESELSLPPVGSEFSYLLLAHTNEFSYPPSGQNPAQIVVSNSPDARPSLPPPTSSLQQIATPTAYPTTATL